MASTMNYSRQMAAATSSDCAPVCCPDCGGLECLCRPRFFPGQLLTDEDLTRLDDYITSKNKLHNRYLVGWGVVCGMNVVCNACDGMVTVKSGYALSPCGDDIVVCADAPVDICSMIQKCTKKQPRDCQPAQPGGPDPCSSTTEQWILRIHYDEKASRGIVPLKNTGSATCCSPCACGGSGSCGCGGKSSGSSCCGGNGKSTTGNGNGKSTSCGCGGTSTATTTSAQAQCQPTIVCETYYFEVCKVRPSLEPRTDFGALGNRFLSCLTALQGLVSEPPPGDNQKDLLNWCCAIRDNLLDFFANNPGYSCSIPAALAVMCQSNADAQTIKAEVAKLLAQYIKDCFCAAFLPPCPCPVEDAGVPLATITVSKQSGACRIISICNLDVRKFATTFPNLAYWLSIFPTLRDLRKALAAVCCKPIVFRKTDFGKQTQFTEFAARAAVRATPPTAARATVGTTGTTGSTGTTGTTVGTPFQQTHDLSQIAASAFMQGGRTVDVQTLAYATLGLTDANNEPFLSPVEMSHPMETLMINQFARPFVEAVLPAGLSKLVSGLGAATQPQPSAATGKSTTSPKAEAQPDLESQLADLKSRLDAMKEDLKRSQDQIDALKKRRNR